MASRVEELYRLGHELGYEGEQLREFVKEEQDREREERARQREDEKWKREFEEKRSEQENKRLEYEESIRKMEQEEKIKTLELQIRKLELEKDQWRIKGWGGGGGVALGAAAMGPSQKWPHKVCQTASQISELILDFSIQLSK